jgi:multiple sugar transport system substrate-binding protein
MLIENTAKATNRNQTTDNAYFEKLYKDMNTLYHLDEGGATSAGKAELGELPSTAVALLGGLAVAWLLIILYSVREWRRKSAKVSQDH